MPTTSLLELSINIDAAADEERAKIARELMGDLNRHLPGCAATPKSVAAIEPGTKGLLEIAGAICVQLSEAGALKAVVTYLATYIGSRRPNVCIAIKTTTGDRVIELKADNVASDRLEVVTQQLRAALAELADNPAQPRH